MTCARERYWVALQNYDVTAYVEKQEHRTAATGSYRFLNRRCNRFHLFLAGIRRGHKLDSSGGPACDGCLETEGSPRSRMILCSFTNSNIFTCHQTCKKNRSKKKSQRVERYHEHTRERYSKVRWREVTPCLTRIELLNVRSNRSTNPLVSDSSTLLIFSDG